MSILVFGGTTEGKQVAKYLDELNIQYFYSTKTKVPFLGKGIPIHGELTTKKIDEFCHKEKISCIINASHPFAEQLHQTVLAIQTQIPLIRFERSFTEKVQHPLVHYVNSFEEAISLFEEKKFKSLLALSGVQTIIKLKPYWENHLTWFRILDRDSSREIARKSGFPSDKLLYGYPQDEEEEIHLFKNLEPSVVLTKESGINGKLDQKIAAALAVKIPIVVLSKPELSERYILINSLDELTGLLRSFSLKEQPSVFKL